MKCIFILLIISINIILCRSQIDPITIEFYEAEPLWEHLVYDTNYYEIDGYEPHKKYTTVSTHLTIRNGDNLIMLNKCRAPNVDSYGYILEKLDINTGESQWIDYNTFYNNDETQEHISTMLIRPDRKIELLGSKRDSSLIENPSPFDIWDFLSYGSKPLKRTYHYNTGELLEFKSSLDSINMPGIYLPVFPVEYDEKYFIIQQRAVPLSGQHKNDSFAFTFYRIDSTFQLVDSVGFDQVVYDTDDSLGYFSIEAQFNILQIDSVSLLGVIHQDRFEENQKLQLLWMDISDWNDVKSIRQVNYENVVPPSNQNRLYFRHFTKNKHIFLTHFYVDSLLGDYVAYLLWLNDSGDIQSIVGKTTIGDHRYIVINPLSANDSSTLILGTPSITGRSGMDILRVKKGIDTLEFLSSITSVHSDEIFYSDMRIHDLYDDGKLIIGAETKVLGQEPLRWVKYYCFEIEDLGVVLSNTSVEPSVKKIKLYPNPTEDQFFLDLYEFKEKNIELTIFDEFGRIVFSDFLRTNSSYQISLENYPTGIYFIRITDKRGKLLRTGKMIKV